MAKILISGKIEEPLVHKFIKDYNDSGNQFKDIYINSEGGYHSLGLVIIDIINSAPSKCCIIAAGEVHSTAFEIFFLTNCRKRILPFSYGMYHMATDDIESDERGKAKTADAKARLENLKLGKNYTLELCKKLGMNKTEVAAIKRGDDVYFQENRLSYFLKQQKPPTKIVRG